MDNLKNKKNIFYFCIKRMDYKKMDEKKNNIVRKMEDEVNPNIIKKLQNITYKQFCDSFYEGNEDLIENEDMKGTYTILRDFVKLAIKNDYKIPQNYKQAKSSPNGRLFVQGAGIQKLPKKVRGLLCDGIYHDYDMINAHPRLLLYLCKQQNIECDKLEEYVNSRDLKLKDFMKTDDIERDEAKMTFLRAINKDKLCIDFFKDKKKKKIKNGFFKEFDKEMKTIQTTLSYKYKNIERGLRKQGIKDNLGGRVLNNLMCKLENDVLNEIIKSELFEIKVLMFDGFMMKPEYEDKLVIDTLNELTEQYGIKWDVKEHDISCHDLVMSMEENSRLYKCESNVIDMANTLLDNELKDEFVIFTAYKEEEYYLKTKKLWIVGEKRVKRYLYQYVTSHDFIIDDKNTSEDDKLSDQLVNVIIKKCNNHRNVDDLVYDSTLTKICFNNGYYDFKEMKFRTDNEVDTYYRIGRDFNLEDSNKEIRKQIYDKIFDPIFTTSVKGRDKLRDYYLYQLASRLAGVASKEWNVVSGSRNCGKGVIADLLGNTFEEYIGVSNIENFKTKSNVGDVAKSMSWIFSKRFNKLIVFNETEENNKQGVLSGTMIKKFTGCDPIELRINRENEMKVKLMGGMMVFCNDFPEFENKDVNEFRVNYNLISKFVDKDFEKLDTSIHYYNKDDDIKRWVKKPEICDEFFRMLIDVYKKGKPILPQEFKDDMKEDNPEEDDTTIYNKFFQDGGKDIFVSNKELKDFINENPELSSLGTYGKICKEIIRRFNCKRASKFVNGTQRGFEGLILVKVC